MHHYPVIVIILQFPSQAIKRIINLAAHVARIAYNVLRLSGEPDGFSRDNLPLTNFTIIKQCQYPFAQIIDGRTDGTSRSQSVDIAIRNGIKLSVNQGMRRGTVKRAGNIRRKRKGITHTQRRKNIFSYKHFPRLTGHHGYDLPCG